MYKEYEAQGFPQSDQENTSESFPLIDVHLLKSYKQKRRLGRSGRNQSLSAATDLKNLDKKNNEFANLNHSSGLHNDISGMKVDQDDSQPTALSSPIGFLRAKSKSPSPPNSVSNRETSSSCKENRNPHHADLKFHQSAPFFLSSQCNNRHQSAGNSSGTSQKPSFMFSNPHDMNRTYLVEKNFIHSTANKEEPVEPLNLSQHHDSANKSVDQLQIDSAPKLSMPELLNKNIHPNKSLSPEFQIHCNRTENQDLPNRILQPNCMPAPLNNNQNLFQRNSVFQKEPPPAHKELCPVQKDPSLIQKEPLPAHKELYPVQRDPSIIQKNSPPAHKELYPVQKDPSLIRKEPPPAHKELCPVQKDPSLIQKEQLPVPKTAPPVQKDASLIQKEPLPAHKELYPVQENPYSVQKEPLPVPKKASPVQKDPCPEYPFKVPALVNHKNQPAPSLNITRTITANQPQIQQRTPLVPVVSQRPTQASPITDNKDNIIYVNSKPYISLSLLGKGGTSKVFLVQDPSSNKLKAIKCVDLSRVDQMFANAYLNEIELLIKLQECDTVIKMFDHEYLENERMLYVVLEKGDTDFTRLIKNLSKEKNEKDPFMIFYYWGQILKAVKDIHDRGIIHSDLKPDNFLLVQGKLKLIDFGIASSLSGDMTSVLLEVTFGTLNYISPEAIPNGHASKHGYKISCKSDVWSLGCILYNLVYGKTPFSHLSRDWIKMQAIVDSTHTIDFPEQSVGWKIPLFLLESMKQCLNRDPKQRPTVGDLINRLKSVCSSISSDKS